MWQFWMSSLQCQWLQLRLMLQPVPTARTTRWNVYLRSRTIEDEGRDAEQGISYRQAFQTERSDQPPL